jgi:hypothetical protein
VAFRLLMNVRKLDLSLFSVVTEKNGEIIDL